MKLQFPENFLWGAATSSHQVEGGNKLNDWWEFESQGKVANHDISGLACDHYHKFREDFDLAKELGHNAHRFSIEWSRIEPEEGKFNEKEINHYKEVLLDLKQKGFKTMVTLHHFTNPLWLYRMGGWENKKVAEYFERYTKIIAENMGEHVDFWCTINEPMVYISQGYFIGCWPPEHKNHYLLAYKVFKNMIKAHKLAYQAIHEKYKDAQVGIAQNNSCIKPANPNSWMDKLAANLSRHFASFWFLDKIKNHQDFIGLNYYFYRRVNANFIFKKGRVEQKKEENIPKSDFGWDIRPEGIYYTAKELWKRYKKPIYITENGVADTEDKLRANFIAQNLKYLHKAIQEGVGVKGYFHWSLMDNFEWAAGFHMRFGLIAIDYKTLKRTPRPSAYIYAGICKNNAIDDDFAK